MESITGFSIMPIFICNLLTVESSGTLLEAFSVTV